MEHDIVDMIVQSKIENRKPRFSALMVKFIVKKLTDAE